MTDIPYAIQKETNYENFTAICPICGFRNIYNRVSDLEDEEPIDFKTVECLNDQCQKSFNINGDHIDPAFKMLIMDCYNLKQDKRYCYCILNLAQAYELFFSLYLQIELLFKPFRRESDRDIERLNTISDLLYENTKRYTFITMRNIFINRVLLGEDLSSLSEAEHRINQLKSAIREPPDTDIANIADRNLSQLLQALKATRIKEVRNKVVHKHAYRPKLAEVEALLEETRSMLFPLSSHLGIQSDDINSYL
jgi:hypothetical protein